jgi:hypothetical protein|nr:MAG TPA: hypothetical protein [Caudoviricetes sp.]
MQKLHIFHTSNSYENEVLKDYMNHIESFKKILFRHFKSEEDYNFITIETLKDEFKSFLKKDKEYVKLLQFRYNFESKEEMFEDIFSNLWFLRNEFVFKRFLDCAEDEYNFLGEFSW